MAKRTIVVAVVLGMAVAAGAAEQPLRVCMLSGAWEYESHESLPVLKKHLEQNYGCQCTIVQAERKTGDNVPGMEALDDADVMVLFMRRQKLKGDQLERFKAWCAAGKPIVGIRTASHAVQTWLAFDKLVLGGNYRGHYGHGAACKVTLTEAGRKHPVCAGVQSFTSRGTLYKNTGLKATNILMYGETPKHREPVTWTHTHQGGRVFYTSLGHQGDFQKDSFLRLLTNAVFWVAEREVPKEAGK